MGDFVTTVVTLLGALAGANLFASGSARRRRALRDELHLLNEMKPDFPERPEFERHVAETAAVYVAREQTADMRRERLWAIIGISTAALLFLFTAVAMIQEARGQGFVPLPTSLVTAALSGAALGSTARSFERMRRHKEQGIAAARARNRKRTGSHGQEQLRFEGRPEETVPPGERTPAIESGRR